jgi:HD-GYP domain-containing protein (c-di-GMP phosphodiesterase class II)
VARAEIVANSRRQFDPRVAEAFLRIIERSGERDLPVPAAAESGDGSVQRLVETVSS